DVIYDDNFTDILFNVFMKLFSDKLNLYSIYITIEERNSTFSFEIFNPNINLPIQVKAQTQTNLENLIMKNIIPQVIEFSELLTYFNLNEYDGLANVTNAEQLKFSLGRTKAGHILWENLPIRRKTNIIMRAAEVQLTVEDQLPVLLYESYPVKIKIKNCENVDIHPATLTCTCSTSDDNSQTSDDIFLFRLKRKIYILKYKTLIADVIYDDDLTDALFNVFIKLFQDKLNLYSICITIEKRSIFYLDTVSIQCPAYEYFA
ncbi:unnamed protein product, partial [Rotaria sp. Silwood1]